MPPVVEKNERDFDPPVDFPAGGSVLDYLLACRRHRGTQPVELRIIKSMLRKARVPRELEEDAAQSIRLAWATVKVKDAFEPEQVLQYAYSIALRAALHERRELQNVAMLPGNGTRTRADGSRYAPPGITARAFSWEDMERYHRTEEQPDGDMSAPSNPEALVVDPGEPGDDQQREELAQEYAVRLTTVQARILQYLASGADLKEIHKHMKISIVRLTRELSIGASIIGADISNVEIKKK